MNEYLFMLAELNELEDMIIKIPPDNILERIGFEYRLEKINQEIYEYDKQ